MTSRTVDVIYSFLQENGQISALTFGICPHGMHHSLQKHFVCTGASNPSLLCSSTLIKFNLHQGVDLSIPSARILRLYKPSTGAIPERHPGPP